MKLLVDVCAGRRLASWLRDRGHDVQEVRDPAPRMEDDDIVAWAVVEGRMVITIDKDFGTLAVALGQPHQGMVRLPDVSATERQRLMEQVLMRHEKDLEAGAIITVSRSHIRVRPG